MKTQTLHLYLLKTTNKGLALLHQNVNILLWMVGVVFFPTLERKDSTSFLEIMGPKTHWVLVNLSIKNTSKIISFFHSRTTDKLQLSISNQQYFTQNEIIFQSTFFIQEKIN